MERLLYDTVLSSPRHTGTEPPVALELRAVCFIDLLHNSRITPPVDCYLVKAERRADKGRTRVTRRLGPTRDGDIDESNEARLLD